MITVAGVSDAVNTECTRPHDQKKRSGKGSNILTLVRSFLNESENWKELKEKQRYQFPGVFHHLLFSTFIILLI